MCVSPHTAESLFLDSSLKLSDVILRDAKEPLDDFCRNALLEAQSRQRPVSKAQCGGGNTTVERGDLLSLQGTFKLQGQRL